MLRDVSIINFDCLVPNEGDIIWIFMLGVFLFVTCLHPNYHR